MRYCPRFIPLAFCLLLVTAVPASAQVSFGGRVGVNIATAEVEPVLNVEYRNRVDWHGGLLVVAAPASPLGAQVELLYSVRGTGIKIGRSGALDADIKLSFIDIPLLARARAFRIGNGGVFLLAGPTFGIGVEAESEQSGVSTDVSDWFKGSEVGLTVGAVFESGGFLVDGRYAMGSPTMRMARNPLSRSSNPARSPFRLGYASNRRTETLAPFRAS